MGPTSKENKKNNNKKDVKQTGKQKRLAQRENCF